MDIGSVVWQGWQEEGKVPLHSSPSSLPAWCQPFPSCRLLYCQRDEQQRLFRCCGMEWGHERTLVVSSKVPFHSGLEERRALSQGWMLREDLPPPAAPLIFLPSTAQKSSILFLSSLLLQLSQPSFPWLQLPWSLQPPWLSLSSWSCYCRVKSPHQTTKLLDSKTDRHSGLSHPSSQAESPWLPVMQEAPERFSLPLHCSHLARGWLSRSSVANICPFMNHSSPGGCRYQGCLWK